MTEAERPLWAATAPAPPDLAPLAGAAEAEICIVGAGFTGLSTAIHLAERGRTAIVLEAREPGAGASGRSGGQVIPGFKHRVADVVADYGPELGTRLHAFGTRTAEATFDLVRRYAIDCDATRGGWIQAAETPAELAEAQSRCAAWRTTGAPTHMLDAAAIRGLTGTDAYRGGWIHEGGGSVQPLAYARGLARAAVSLGVRVHARSPATALHRDGAGWRVVTPDGVVKARRVLLATNALTGALAPAMHRAQLAVRSFQIATRPLTPAERTVILPRASVVSDTRRVLRYFRVDRDHRVVVGGKGTIGAPRGPASFAVPRRMLEALYPALARDGVAYWWGGEVGVTLDRLPRLLAIDDGVLGVLQDNGKGVAWCSAAGAPLAEALCGAPLDSLPLPPARPPRPIPLHALRRVYAAAGSLWLRTLDAIDHARAARERRSPP